jgi:hypothetical protein
MRKFKLNPLTPVLAPLVLWVFIFAPAIAVCSPLSARNQDATQQWQGRALAEFPALGVSGSPFNSLFLGEVRRLRETKSQLLQDPSWPYRIAKRVAASPELALANALIDAKKSAPETASQPAVGDRPAKPASGRIEQEAAPTDKSAALAEVCVYAVEAELASGVLKEDRGVWIQEGKISPRLRARALRSAKVISEAAYTDVLQHFLERILRASGDLGEEDLNWVKAFLAADEVHAAFAGLLGLPEIQLVESLLAKADSPGFTLDWLGGGSGGFVPPMKIPAPRRLEILERVFARQFQLGAMRLSKEACQAMCFRINAEVAGGGFLLLETLSVKDFPESCLVNSNAPASKFSPLRREWVAYMKSLVQMLEDLKIGRFAPFSTYFPACAGTGGFEQFVLWESLRRDSLRESILWVDSLAPELYKHAGVQAREARRVLPALNYVLGQLALAEEASARVTASQSPKPVAATVAPKPVAKLASKPATATASVNSAPVVPNGKNTAANPAQSARAPKAGAVAK